MISCNLNGNLDYGVKTVTGGATGWNFKHDLIITTDGGINKDNSDFLTNAFSMVIRKESVH